MFGVVFSLAGAFFVQQIRPKPPHVYSTVQRMASDGLSEIEKELPEDSKAASDIALARRVMKSNGEDSKAFQRTAYLFCGAFAIQSLLVLAASEKVRRKLANQ